eukprot:7315830-Ditylum_brightwellii.AAC.1
MASLEMHMVLKAYPEAAREKDTDSFTPLYSIYDNKSASLKMVQLIADEWLKAKENRTSHSAISFISEMEEDGWEEDEWDSMIRDNIIELFYHRSSLFDENNQSNPPP